MEHDERVAVVVGVDGSAGSRTALAEAMRSAARRGSRLRVVAAYQPPEFQGGWMYGVPSGLRIPTREELASATLKAARAMVTEVAYELGDEIAARPPTKVAAVPGRPAEVLVDAARDADELVIGHRGRGALFSALLGSVGLSCVLHARCPVTVVPDAA